ncbi:STAS/SEC14 domain-containing protein [Roseisolibacter agri]|uniref:STAS/SEC14 domain-containing protein n=1 Tax=Roseisolibacter agri TaxID=2014610 RepID=A0AA37QJK4_9BACT|nr:STAS/SEC14 domain-containing protein [Roseisolibacter agri]GLC28083.1 hypothetical protein rosag_45960 [Roseisolibacter agri]
MTIEAEFTEGLLVIRGAGTVTASDLREMPGLTTAFDAGRAVTPNRLIDLTAVEGFDVGFSEMLAAVRERRDAVLSGPTRTAFLTASAVQFGMARMFQTLNDNAQITVRIFEDRAEALAWLRSLP